MQKRQYHREMRSQMQAIPAGEKILLHSCCGPCSSAVLEKLAAHFRVTLLYYNPNIWPETEYHRRRDEQVALLQQLPVRYPVEFVELPHKPDEFYAVAQPLASAPEGGARCEACFRLRLQRAAQEAAQRGIPWLTTTLTVSPHKNAPLLNQLGEEAAARQGLSFLPSDFKKEEGYKRSLELSAQYGLYRQEYCGCEYSYRQRFPQCGAE